MRREPFDPGITQRYEGPSARIVNRDGSFNVNRRGGRLRDFHFYRWLIDMSWPAFVAVIVGAFVVVNGLFTGLYLLVGTGGLQGLAPGGHDALQVFFFSVQTITTVGYGVDAPRSVAANIVASVEALLGVLGFAFSAGLMYGRFSRPVARLLFSSHAIVAPYHGGASLQLRLANLRRNVILDNRGPSGYGVGLKDVDDVIGGRPVRGESVTSEIGEPTTEISATPLMWKFFMAHPMP